MQNTGIMHPGKSNDYVTTKEPSSVPNPQFIADKTDAIQNQDNKSSKNKTSYWNAFVGLFMGLLSGASFAVSDIFALLCIKLGYSPAQALLVKSLVTMAAAMPFLIYKKVNILKLSRKDTLLNVVKSLSENAGDFFYYYGLDFIGMGDTTSIVVGSLPIFTPILARLFIHEHFRFHDCISIIINIAGIVLIARPEFIFGDTTDAPAIGYIYAILTGLGLAIGTVCGREMSDGQSLLVVIFYNGLCGAILMLILVYPTSSYRMYVLIPQYPITIAYMVAMVAWYILYLYTYNRALQLLSAGKVALLANGSMIVGFIADVTVFNREIVYLEFIGAALIILSAAVVCVLVWFETRKELNENTKLIKN